MHESSLPQYQALAFGEFLWDQLSTGDVLGGAPGNFIFHLTQLGTSAAVVTRVGIDPLGQQALELYAHAGCSTHLIQHDPHHPTGTVTVELNDAGSPSYTIHQAVAYDYIELTDELLSCAEHAKLIHYSTLVQRSEKARETLYSLLQSTPHSIHLLDLNLRPKCYSKETVTHSLSFADIIKLNDEEVVEVCRLLEIGTLSPQAFSQMLFEKFHVGICLVTMGKDGVLAFSPNENVSIPGISVQVEDTVGAGDAFTAGFVHSYLQEKPLQESCQSGNQLGALVASKQGGMPHISKEELSNLLKTIF